MNEADFPGAFTARRNLVVGPLAMMGAGKDKVYFFPDFASDVGMFEGRPALELVDRLLPEPA